MLNLIDNLPGASKTVEAMSLDEQHQALIRDTLKATGQEAPKYAPPMSQWTMESSLLAQVIDAVNALRHVVIVTSGDGKNKPKPPDPVQRPRTAAEKVDFQARRAAHKRLADRILMRRGAKPLAGGVPVFESTVERVTGVQQNAPNPGTMSGDATT